MVIKSSGKSGVAYPEQPMSALKAISSVKNVVLKNKSPISEESQPVFCSSIIDEVCCKIENVKRKLNGIASTQSDDQQVQSLVTDMDSILRIVRTEKYRSEKKQVKQKQESGRSICMFNIDDVEKERLKIHKLSLNQSVQNKLPPPLFKI